MTEQEYCAECKAVAKAALEDAGRDYDLSDAVHESIDGHHYIIYTAESLDVLRHSRNDGAYFEDFGSLEADSFADAVAKMAFCAMEQDVYEYIEDLKSDQE